MESNNYFLQHEVQADRVNVILKRRKPPVSTEVISDEELENVPPSTPPNIPPAQKPALHPPTANTHIYTNQSLPAYSYYTNQSRRTTYTNHTPASLPPATNAYMHTSNQYSPPTTVSPTQLHSHSSIHTPLTPLQTKHIPTSTPFRKKHTFMSLLEDDSMQDDVPYNILSMTPSTSRDSSLSHGPGGTSDWSSFASHFTAEFESLKAEVDTLRTEVKSLRKTIKANKGTEQSDENEEGSLGSLLSMTANTGAAFDGLKMVLLHLFSDVELRVSSSLKGVTTVAGGSNPGLNKEKLNLLHTFMERRYKTESKWP
ncbi:hypothetical protein OS493_000321 [Desmophyllum pertusum]|uniref:Uncharacterized protein n=1 Tax=Desmophyllum pertusum TaxID=174260 RepID=A0A9X0A709_9CNID|nr:hypothetical protein OS493_000321 [Desmophyllum pertusum]